MSRVAKNPGRSAAGRHATIAAEASVTVKGAKGTSDACALGPASVVVQEEKTPS